MRLATPASAPAAKLVLFWCAVLGLAVAIKLGLTGRPVLGDDSFQYLSVAQNLTQGLGFRTSLIHFDEERSWGTIPAPLTTWPVGYPIAIAAVHALGIPQELAGAILSGIATVVTLALLAVLSSKLGIARFGQFVVLGLFALNFMTCVLSFAVASDALFTAVVVAAVAMLVATLEAADAGMRWAARAVGGGLLLALAYWLRYAGIFVFLGVCAGAAGFLVLRRMRAFWAVIAACAIAGGGIVTGILRNVLLVGSWKGGNNEVVHHNAGEIIHDFAVSVRDLVIGDMPARHLLIARSLMLCVLAVAVILTLARYRTHTAETATNRGSPRDALLLLMSVVLTYVACLAYAAITTVIRFNPRYLYPMLPLTLLVAFTLIFGGVSIRARGRSIRIASWLVVLLTYALIQLDAWARFEPARSLDAAEQTVASRIADGRTVRDLVLAETGPRDSLMSTNGQAIGYLLHRQMVSLPEPVFTNETWSEAFVRSTLGRFAVRMVLIGTGPAERAISPFIEQLASGRSPSWLTKIAATDQVVVYRVAANP